MALVLSPEQQRLNRHGKAHVGYTAGSITHEVVVTGKIGVLEHFGFTVEDAALDLGGMGVDLIQTRKGHRRSRWLGDTIKTAVKENQAIKSLYPSKRGTALRGEPIVMQNLQTGDKWTVQLDGDIGIFIAALTQKTNPCDIQLWGKTGNRYGAPILKAAPPAPGGLTGAKTGSPNPGTTH